MKQIVFLLSFVFVVNGFGQSRSTFTQYMLNQQQYNPGYADIATRYNASLAFRKQWLSLNGAPTSFYANGGYSFTKNHYLGGAAIMDKVGQISTLNANVQYTYHAWLNRESALGFGISVGMQQRSLNNDFIYFGNYEPNLENSNIFGLNVGTGISYQNKNFDIGASLPFIFDNQLGDPSKIFTREFNHAFVHMGYKFRKDDDFIFYPTFLGNVSKGSPYALSFNGHFLVNQFYWFGGGYRSDNTFAISFGFFMEKGLRLIYSYESSYFSPHKRISGTHEITLNYARSLADHPFARRKFTKRKGGQFRRRIRR